MEKEIEIRSDEVQEILTDVPGWMIRYGISLIFGIVIALLILSWFIKYPDTVQGEAELTTLKPPATLVAQTSGYIEELHVVNDAAVAKGQLLAELLNPVKKETIDSLKLFIHAFNLDSVKVQIEILGQLKTLGQAQDRVNALYNKLIAYDRLINDPYYVRSLANLDYQIAYNNRLALLADEQLKLFNFELKSARVKFQSDSVLYAQGVIAKITFLAKQSEYVAKQQTLLNAQKSRIQYRIAAANYTNQKNELQKSNEDAQRRLETEIRAGIKSLSGFVDQWQLSYMLISPIAGRVAYRSNLSENEFVKSEQALFTIIPAADSILCIVRIAEKGYGKIKPGQKVRIKLNNYPFRQYGQLEGSVAYISKIAGAKGYFIKVKLPHGLTTGYHQKMDYKPGMTGTAEIVTEDLRLIERIFYSIRKIFE